MINDGTVIPAVVCFSQIFKPYHIKILSAVPDFLAIFWGGGNFRSPRYFFGLKRAEFKLNFAQ